MNQKLNKTIEAIVKVETGSFEEEVSPPWIISKGNDWFTYVRIYSGISDEEIGLVMFSACLSSSVASSDEIIKDTALETLEIFVADEGFILSGGLEFKENDTVKMSPGCCCGLEDWKSWLDVPNGNTLIWNGHDPFASVEIDDGVIKIWEDKEIKDEGPTIEFLPDELTEKMKNVENDLKDFLFKLAQWTRKIEPALENKVVNHFAKNMNIEI